jgi:hypothetical protein
MVIEPTNKYVEKTPNTIPNPAYDVWLSQDQIVLGYHLQSISREVLPHAQSIEHASRAWKAVEEMFDSQSEAKVTNLRIALTNTKKLLTFLTKMQGICRGFVSQEHEYHV